MSSPTLCCLAVDHRTAPLALLERLTLEECSMRDLIERSSRLLRSSDKRAEVVVLNTCNRFEVYWCEGGAAAIYRSLDKPDDFEHGTDGGEEHPCRQTQLGLRRLIAGLAATPEEELSPYLNFYTGRSVVDHLLRVASGLESLVIGEHQILGQVEQAFSSAKSAEAAGPIMDSLQNAALRCGRRARHETEIGRNPRDVSTVAIQLSEKLVGKLDQRRVLVAGAGEMGRAVAKSLSHRKVEQVIVVNRSLETAREITQRWGGDAHSIEEIEELLDGADVVFASTSSREPILTEPAVRKAMERRSGRPIALIDLAVPRDIEPAAGAIEGVYLFDLEGLREIAEAGEAERRQAIPGVEAIVEDELQGFQSDLGALAVRPVLAELWNGAEETRRTILQDARSRLDGLSEEQWSEIENLTQLLTKKLLHVPSTRLRTDSSNGHTVRYADLISHLFGLSNELNEG